MGKETDKSKQNSWYAHYVLFVLVIVYVFNFIDRNIIAILAEDIQRDLGINDAQLGFMYGTVFAVFYAVFGIPLGRFADVWVRRSLIASGLAFWSAFTMLSGFARSFPLLSICRMGVGIGEASASPAAYSMIADYYSPKLRSTVMAVYSSGIFIGGGIGLFLGGFLLDTWANLYPNTDHAPLGLKGWQAAFIAVGAPGLLLAIWVRTLKEPVRGSSEGLVVSDHPAPFSVLGTELKAMMPVFNLFALKRDGGSVKANLVIAAIIVAIGTILTFALGNAPQWIALGIGVYIVATWTQSLAVRDYATFVMVCKSKALIYQLLAVSLMSVVSYGMYFWLAPLLLRIEGTNPADVGLYIGLSIAFGGFIGVLLGGILGDLLRTKHPCGRFIVVLIAIAGATPFGILTILSESLKTAAFYNFFFMLFSTSVGAIPAATATDLVMPRMRGMANAVNILVGTFIGLAIGPFAVGFLSDLFAAQGHDTRSSLQFALMNTYFVYVVSIVLIVLAWRHLPAAEATRLERARALGEPD